MAQQITPGMWVRRVVSSILLLVILVGIIWGGTQLYGAVHTRLAGRQEQIQLAEQNLPVKVRECGSSDLEVTVTPQAAVVLVGEGLTATVRISGKAADACSFNTADLDLQLQTGEQVVWSPTRCSKSWERILLLGAGDSWERDIKWKGNLYDGCSALKSGDESNLIADPGKYTFGGALLTVRLEDLPSVEVKY